MPRALPNDADLLDLQDSTTDSGLRISQVGESPYYLSEFKTLWRIDQALLGLIGGEVYKDSAGALKFGVTAGKFFNGDSLVSYAGASNQALTDNATNYIYLTAAGALAVNTTGFPVPSVTPHVRLAVIKTGTQSAGGIAGQYDFADIAPYHRLLVLAGGAGGAGSFKVFDWQASVLDEINLVTSEPGSPTVGDRYLNTATGNSSQTGQAVVANRIYEWNGTSWTESTPSEGFCCMVEDRDMLVGYNGSAWVDIGTFALLAEAKTFFAATDISAAEAEVLTDLSNADALHKHHAVEADTHGSGDPNVLAAAESLKVLTNEGSSAKNYHTLPSAAAGLQFTFIVQDADGLRITAAAGDTIRIGETVSKAAGFAESTVIGSALVLIAINATEWIATSAIGTWDVETT